MWLFALLAATVSAASFNGQGYIVHETSANVPVEWTYMAPADSNSPLNISIALKQPRLGELRARLEQIGKPGSDDFGKHLSRRDLSYYQDTAPESVESVLSWLTSFGINEVQRNGARINVGATVGQVNQLLDCQLEIYRGSNDREVFRAREYGLPTSIVQYIDYVFPVTQFISAPRRRAIWEATPAGHVHARQIGDEMPGSCSGSVDPLCLVDMYGINYYPEDASSNSSLAIAGFLEQYPSNPSLHSWLLAHSPRLNTSHPFDPTYNLTIETINGGLPTDNGTGVEALVDTEYTVPFVQPLPVTYYSTGGRGPFVDEEGNLTDPGTGSNEPWTEFIEALLAKEEVPQVLSISYTDDERSIPPAYAVRVCDLFMQLASRGVSVLIASGDGGQAGIGGGNQCTDGRFLPTFPVDCPYVTAVGATGFYWPPSGAWYSSGGFSEYFERPSWQEDAASAYISKLNGSHDGWYNASGRGIPDISAVGSHFLIRNGDAEWSQSGTSMSTPVVASMIALVNDKRLRAGKPVLGFLNPILYSDDVKDAFRDITDGNGGSCPYGSKVEFGFDALEGWDPVTGLGTPNFPVLMDALFAV